jgi:hypothetical protein
MIRSFVIAVVLAGAMSTAVAAQQAAESVNVMPVWVPCDLATDAGCASDPRWADAWRFGDIFLQRQVEGGLAPSSLNPNRILNAFIDYSAVESFSDQGLGDTVAQHVWTRVAEVLAKIFHLPRRSGSADDEEEDRPKGYAASEAWIRLTWSTNGGATSTPFFMPGSPWDTSPAGQTAPYYQAANASSDPVVVSAPNGDFHVIFMAFTRGQTNWMVDGRFRDLNIPDEPTRHGLTFLGFTQLASGNNASFGTFHDKPHATTVVNPASPAGYDLYVSYTLFNGNPGGGKFQSQLFVAKSSDGGVTFTTDKINQSTNQNTGTWLVATNGRVYAFWRGFGPSDIFFVKQSGGAWTKAQSILGKTPLAAFDQGNIKVDPANLPGSEGNITPRSNAFPSAAAAADGTIFVVFQECADAATGAPKSCGAGGSPRIMLTSSRDGGATWTARTAFDNGIRNVEPDGLGYFWSVGRSDNNAHPQLMPAIACGAGQCLVTYWESRTPSLTANGWIGGYNRLMDLRGAALNADGSIARSFQISRYPYRPGTRLIDPTTLGPDGKPVPRPENVNDVAVVNEIVNADGTRSCAGPPGVEPPLPGLQAGCIPRLNFYCRPQSGGGTTCFMGDYNAVVPATSFVRGANGSWKLPTSPAEVPYVGFLTASSDNRNLVPPAALLPSRGGTAPDDQLSRYTAWTPGSNGLPACTVGGSRNTDLLLAKVSFGLLVTAPITAKTTPSPGDAPFLVFPLQVWNNSATPRTVTLTIDPPGTTASSGSFSKTATTAKSGTVTVNAYSSTTREVYATTTAPVSVQVSDGTTTSSITFNAVGAGASAPSTPGSITVSDPLAISAENISAENISAENISAENISAENISAENISAENISAENISAENLGVQETTWVIQASGDPTKAYTALANVDKAYSNDYDFHVIIYRLASIGACVDANGKPTLQYSATVVANTGAVNISAENISAENISAENISAENGFPSDPTNILNNSIFTPKPATPPQSAAARQAGTVPSGGYRIGEGVEAQPPEREFHVVKLLAIPKKPLDQITAKYQPAKNPASLTVSNYWCDTGCTPVLKGSDLVIGGAPTVTPSSLPAGSAIAIGTVSVSNVGTLDAGPRRYGYYLSHDTTLDLLGTGLVDTSKDIFLGSVDSFTDPLTPGSTDQVPQTSLTVPLSVAPGTWYLFVYADDLRKVSELSESNNITPAAAITILADTTPPVFDPHGDQIAEATGPAGATVTYSAPAAVDAVDGPVTATCTPPSGTAFALGSTTITCMASDKSGNTATTTFFVKVVDTTGPAIASHANVTTEAANANGAAVTYTNPTASDIVDGSVPVSCVPASGSVFALGSTTVTCTATDRSGNTASPGTFIVKVVDTTAPVISGTPAGVTREATGPTGAIATWVSPSASDAVDGTVAVTCAPLSGSLFPLGNTTVTCSAKDASLNAATPTTFVVQVVDTTAPVLMLPSPIANATSASGAIVAFSATAVDLVDGARPVACLPASGSIFPIGATTVTCSASDTRGNSSTGTFVVMVTVRYGFVGVQNLPPPAGKTFNSGSAIPLRWQFTIGGVPVNSANAVPQIRISGPAINQTFTPADPGNSSFQPPTAANGWTWQFNWQTPSTAGTYSVTVVSGQTGDSFSGGLIKLK